MYVVMCNMNPHKEKHLIGGELFFLGTADTSEDAYRIMENDFISTFKGHHDMEDFINNFNSCDNWRVCQDEARLQDEDANYHWEVFKVG